MATSQEFINYVCEQLEGTGTIRYKKMFGEYMVYVNEKPLIIVCNDTAFIKMCPEIENWMKGTQTGFPYRGAKEHYILDVDNTELCQQVVAKLELCTALPKKKPKKGKKESL